METTHINPRDLLEKVTNYKFPGNSYGFPYSCQGFTLKAMLDRKWVKTIPEAVSLSSYLANSITDDIGVKAYYFAASMLAISESIKALES